MNTILLGRQTFTESLVFPLRSSISSAPSGNVQPLGMFCPADYRISDGREVRKAGKYRVQAMEGQRSARVGKNFSRGGAPDRRDAVYVLQVTHAVLVSWGHAAQKACSI